MNTETMTESELHLAVEQLRSQHKNTLDLYQAVAALLFFQYQTTPTTNRMYQLVRKGSMSAPAEALKLFWQELRARSQVRMEQADIPNSLQQQTAVLVEQLWQESLAQAEQILESNNQEIYTHLALAQTQQKEAKEQATQAQQALLTAQRQLQQQDTTIEELEKTVQQQQIEHAALAQQIEGLQAENQRQNDKVALSEQRAADMEKYARLEIDRARQELTASKAENQRLQQQAHKQTEKHIILQQAHHFLERQLNESAAQQERLQLQNQELNALLQQLQQAIQRKNQQQHNKHSTRISSRSRLARLRDGENK